MQKREITFNYIVFYILFLPDTWQVLTGILAAWLLVPLIQTSAEMGVGGKVMLYIMVATIGYAAFRKPAEGLTRLFKKWILGDKIS